MKANRAIKNDRAEVGVGTLIVFIAMVLVAAVAAAVLINTSGSLQQRAQATGKEATQEVSSNLKVLNVYGVIDDDTDKIGELRVNVQLSAGALPMDLEQLIIRFSDGTNTINYKWFQVADIDIADPDVETCAPATIAQRVPLDHADIVESKFTASWLRPVADNTNQLGCAGKSVMKAGDLVELRFALKDNVDNAGTDKTIDVRKSISVSLIPETGSSVAADFKTPATFGDADYITLR
ncbi:MAG TPA: archaellin/type IV pilin N-terminal domain-containing protein [Candidatus Thermoplasmatota archaeon]|nr:archaellin/type IV pilin N-terminal domain-containing protein [Candidatus Thermoplasmatota archaeon]